MAEQETWEHTSTVLEANIENPGAQDVLKQRWPNLAGLRKYRPETVLPTTLSTLYHPICNHGKATPARYTVSCGVDARKRGPLLFFGRTTQLVASPQVDCAASCFCHRWPLIARGSLALPFLHCPSGHSRQIDVAGPFSDHAPAKNAGELSQRSGDRSSCPWSLLRAGVS